MGSSLLPFRAKMFIVEESGVVFSEQTQKIYLLNSTAAFVWSCLEDRSEYEEIVRTVCECYDIPRENAEPEVKRLLAEWAELGLLAGTKRPETAAASEPPNTEGEGKSPVSGETALPSSWYSEKNYRLLDRAFRLRCSTEAEHRITHGILSHLEADEVEEDSRVCVDVVEHEGFQIVYLEGNEHKRTSRLDEIGPLVKHTILARAIDDCPSLLYIHAGVVRAPNGNCLLLPAEPGSGKSSLTATMIGRGFGYLSDEVALLEGPPVRVRAVPVSLCVKETGWDLLASRYPQISDLPVHHRWDDKNVRYLNPPTEALDSDRDRSYPVNWIVFPHYRPDEPTELRPLGRAEALDRFLYQASTNTALKHADVAQLVQWIENVVCCELYHASLDEAERHLEELCAMNPAQIAPSRIGQ